MQFPSELLRGVLLQRYKRFFADVRLDSGEVVTAHCPNTGSMKTCAVLGAPVWLSRATNAKRKLKFTWEIVETDGQKVYVNPSGANDLVVEALKRQRIPGLAGYDVLTREVRYGENSRIDVMLSGNGRCYVEVKNVTLDIDGSRSAFPDSVTERGRKHLIELMQVVKQGDRAVMLFCASREGTRAVLPADAIDPEYGRTLRQAHQAGVELLAHAVEFSDIGVHLGEPLPVVFE